MTTEATATAADNTEGAANTEVKTVLTAEVKPAEAADAGKPDESQTKAEDDKSKDGEADKDKKSGAPESYEAFKMPDGVEVDTAMLAEFQPVAKELNLDQAGAQKLVDLYTKASAQMAERQQKVWADTQDKWVADAKADKEYGGEKFNENVAIAKKAIDAFGTPELKEALAATGAGNHPEFIRFCMRVGKGLAEDKFVSAGSASAGKRDPAEILFGKSP